MGDELEKFIVRHRQEFETEEPGGRVWKGIQSGLKSKGIFEMWWKIAAVFFFASTAYLLFDKNLDIPADDPDAGTEVAEFLQAEDYYIKLISEKKAEIARYDRGLMKREFLLEIDRLDQLYAELKRTYEEQNSTDLLVDAMITNLKLRIDILNQQIKILEKLNDTENETESTIEI